MIWKNSFMGYYYIHFEYSERTIINYLHVGLIKNLVHLKS